MKNNHGTNASVRKKQKGGRYAAAKTKPKKKKFFTWKTILLLIPAVSILIAAAVVLMAVDHGSTYEFLDNAQTYYAGGIGNIKAGAIMQMDQEGVTTLTQDRQSTEIDLPLFLENSPSVVLSEDMLYYMPRSGRYGRALHFSQISCTDAGVMLSRDGKESRTDRGFLYDGNDIYIFLEPVILTFNGYTIELPALSYVEAEYGGYIMVVNYETKECIMEPSTGSGTVTPAAGGYEISLLYDSMVNGNGQRELLISVSAQVDPIA